MLRNIFMLVSASLAAQLIGVLFLPVLSRLYSEEAFGTYQIYVTTLNLCLMVVALRYEVALLVAGTPTQVKMLLRLVVRLCLVTSGLVAVVAVLLLPWLSQTYPEFLTIAYVLPLAMLAGGLLHLMSFVLIHDRRYKLSAVMKFTQASSYVAAGLALAFTPFALVGLLLADAIGRLAATGLALIRVRGLLGDLLGPLRRIQARAVAWRFRDYPAYIMPGTFIASGVALLTSLTFFGLFDLAVAGQYALVERFILQPVALIAGAATQVFTGDFAEQVRRGEGEINRKFRRTVLALFAVSIIPAGVLYFTAPVLVPFVFGEQWQLAGLFCQVAVPLVVVTLATGPVNMVLLICDRQVLQLGWQIFRLALVGSAFGVLMIIGYDGPVDVMRWYVLSVVAAYLVYLVLADRVTAQLDTRRLEAR